ncbi:hypothetical protein MKW94_016037 [Papaver nudicaule]|uniref:Uncharacterized protein n=1 Tax=Papaver nudicaule TaxID=74823 RepID=A0AA41V2Y0_PAPNU|nr:hypothetical protein [Papaver nudicaule]
MALSKVLVAVMLLVSLTTVSAHLVPIPKPPVYVAPASPPVYSPAPSPIYSPAPSPPIYAPVPSPLAAPPTPVASPPKYVPEKRQIAVQGVVYCKSCKYTAYNTLMEATALPERLFLHCTIKEGEPFRCLSGAYLMPTKPSKPLPFALFTVGPFANYVLKFNLVNYVVTN